VRNITVSNAGEEWFVSILTERQVERPAARGPAVGIDRGIARSMSKSDGASARRRLDRLSSIKGGSRRTEPLRAEFECAACGFRENADLVGALNVLRAGHAGLACAETAPAYEAPGQEPTDAFSQDF
jgi:transposase